MNIKQIKKIRLFLGFSFVFFNIAPSLAATSCTTQQSPGLIPCCCQTGAQDFVQYWVDPNSTIAGCNACYPQGDCYFNEECPDLKKRKGYY